MKRKSNKSKKNDSITSKLSQKRNNQFSIENFITLPNKTISETPKEEKKPLNELNKVDEVNKKIIEKELSLINKSVYIPPSISKKKQKDIYSMTFPIVILTNIGIIKGFPLSNVQQLFEEKEQKVYELTVENKECILLYYNDKKIGYVSKEISTSLCQISNNKMFSIEYYIYPIQPKIMIVIRLNYAQYEIKIKEKDEHHFLYSIALTKSTVINSVLTKELKDLYEDSLNDKEKYDDIESHFNDIKAIKNKSKVIEDDSYSIESKEEESNLVTSYLLDNIEKVISMIKYYSFLFDSTAQDVVYNYSTLSQNEKVILASFITRSSKWINVKKITNTSTEIETLKDKKCIVNMNIEEMMHNYSKLFEFFYYLNVNDLKEIEGHISNLTKNKSKCFVSPNTKEISKIIKDIFINNPYYGLNNYLINNELSDKSEVISQYYTSIVFNPNNIEKKEKKEIIMNSFVNHFHKEMSNNAYNNSYIKNNLNYSNFKKVHLYKTTVTSKILLISNIIDNIDYYIKDRSSSFMEGFLMSNQSESKRTKLKQIFNKYSYMYSLSSTFAALFDTATRLFFFYSEYKDINSIMKEFYGMDAFEKYNNYITNKLIESNNEYSDILKPIFVNKAQFELYDSLYQFKIAYNISALSMTIKDTPLILYKVLSGIFELLLKYSNEELYKEIMSKYKEIPREDKDYEIIDEFLLQKIEEKYRANKNIEVIKDCFKLKYTSNHISNELLTYMSDICEKNKLFYQANFIYMFMILSKYLIKKRGLWWHRSLLNYSHHLKSKFNAIRLLNCIKHDVLDSKVIKSGYLFKIKELYNRLIAEKVKKRVNKVLNQLKSDLFYEGNLSDKFFNTKNAIKDNFSINSIYKTIHSDSIFNEYTGRRLYATSTQGITTVEQFAIEYYGKNFSYVGIHGENEVIPSLLNIFLWDCIYYDKIPYVFQSPYQSFPLDFFYPEFYTSRKEIIDKRLEEIEHMSQGEMVKEINRIFETKKNIKSVFINWKSFNCTKENMINIAIAMTAKKMVKIFKEIVKNIKFVIKGMPDLFLWKSREETFCINGKTIVKKLKEAQWDSLKIVEVKSTNDKLSEHQKFWLTLLHSCDIDIEVLHIV